MNSLPVVLSILFGTLSTVGVIIGATWALAREFSGIRSELSGINAVLLSTNKRIERLEKWYEDGGPHRISMKS